MTGIVRLHRVFATPPGKLYDALLAPDAIVSWLPLSGSTCTVHTLDSRAGGHQRMSFRVFTIGSSHSFGGIYLSPDPDARIAYVGGSDAPALPGEMTLSLAAARSGVEVTIEQAGVPDIIPVDARILGGWKTLPKQANLVEPVNPDQGPM